MDFPEQTVPTLEAVMDRIIPRDEFPAASENGVVVFFRRQWSTALRDKQDFLVGGLRELDAEAQLRHHLSFAQLASAEQDELLRAIERGEVRAAWPGENPGPPHAKYWFNHLVELVAEGYYANPGNGGNPAQASWRMIGYKA